MEHIETALNRAEWLYAHQDTLEQDARTLAAFVEHLRSPGLNEVVACRRILYAPAPPEPKEDGNAS